jgi:phospholipid N-methyltransferase
MILQKMHPDSTLICVEINPSFSKILRLNFPAAKIYTDSAVNIRPHLEKHAYKKCDTIISGLPWASFPVELQVEIIKEIHSSLSPDGTFHTFAYTGIHMLPK